MAKFPVKFAIAILCALGTGLKSAFADHTTSEPEASSKSVSKCYKCEDDCNGGVGKVETCHPDAGDHIKFACYKLVINGKTFQRGCTRDFSEGDECIDQKGGMYCFCRNDACNRSSLPQKISKLFVLCVTMIMISFQRSLREL